MNNISFLIINLLLLATPFNSIFANVSFFDPCPEDTEVAPSDLPASIVTYISSNFTNATLGEAEKYNVNGVITFMVELESEDNSIDDTELVFDAEGAFLGSYLEPEEEKKIELPDLALDNLNSAFQDVAVEEVEMNLGWNGVILYEVELENNQEILLDVKGNMVCVKD